MNVLVRRSRSTSGIWSTALSSTVATKAATIPTAKPTTERRRRAADQVAVAVDERDADPGDRAEVRARRPSRRRSGSAGRSRCRPRRSASTSTMKSRKLWESSTFSEVREATFSQTTGSEPMSSRRRRWASAGDAGDLGVDLLDRDRAVAVDVELAQVGDEEAGVATGDVAEDQVALRLARDALEVDDVEDRLGVLEQLEDVRGSEPGGAMIRRWTTRLIVRPTPPLPRPRVACMGLEIERKFLAERAAGLARRSASPVPIRQGYVALERRHGGAGPRGRRPPHR